MIKQGCRWLPGQCLILVVDRRYAAVALALPCVKHRMVMVSRLFWGTALYHRPGPKPLKGRRQRSLQAWANRSDTPWEAVEVDYYGG
jgi:hypothetical protein